MSTPFIVRTVVMSSGERLPMLLSRGTGEPLYLPTLYISQNLRAQNRASNTIEQSLRSILILQIVLDELGINLLERLRDGQLLSIPEVEVIARTCRYPTQKDKLDSTGKVVTLHASEVSPKTMGIRINYIVDYIEWVVADYIAKHGHKADIISKLSVVSEIAFNALKARIPRTGKQTILGDREGLEKTAIKTMKALTVPGAKTSPWVGEFAKTRNALIVEWLYNLGLRRGELLGVRISDINFQKNTVKIIRRADDRTDPRRNQPNAKTRDREIPLSSGLAQMTRDYIMGVRKSIPGARKHDFLMVASGTGAPLSLIAVNKVFEVLRSTSADLPADLSPHRLRHTWNDNFSVIADTNKIAPAEEQKMRSYLMGWSETSGTAFTYTKRHTREAATQVSLDMQKVMMGDSDGK